MLNKLKIVIYRWMFSIKQPLVQSFMRTLYGHFVCITDASLLRKCGFTGAYKNNKFLLIAQSKKYIFEYKPFVDAWHVQKGYLRHYPVKQGDVVLDAGAFQGVFTILLSGMVGPMGKVIAFEPDPKNYSVLLNNLKSNAINNVIALNKGIWSTDGQLHFYRDKSVSSTLAVTAGEDFNHNSEVMVEVVNLDNELERQGIERVDFIKMDIEGAELEALQGAFKVLKRNKINLAIATYHIREGQPTFKEVEKILAGIGYEAFTEPVIRNKFNHCITFGKKRI